MVALDAAFVARMAMSSCLVLAVLVTQPHHSSGYSMMPSLADKRRPMAHQPPLDSARQGLLLDWLKTMPGNLMNMKSRLKLGAAFQDARSSQDVLKMLASTARQKPVLQTNTIYRDAQTKPYHPSIRFHFREEQRAGTV